MMYWYSPVHHLADNAETELYLFLHILIDQENIGLFPARIINISIFLVMNRRF